MSGPTILAILAIHVLAGIVAAAGGALAALTKKGPSRHPRLGATYFCALVVVFVTALALAAIRWPHDVHLAALGAISFGAASAGVVARRRRPRGWMTTHIVAMGTSYVALLTAFYVDNSPQLPLWNRLPPIAFWVVPTIVGVPIVALAFARGRVRRRSP